MFTNKKIADISNYLAASILLVMGFIYLFKSSFMPYHSEALSMDWNEIDKKTQILLLAFMRALSGGFLATSIAIIFLQYKLESTKISWLPLLILITGLTISLGTLYGTLMVRLNTPGKAPFFLNIIGIVLLLIGYIFNKKYLVLNTNSISHNES